MFSIGIIVMYSVGVFGHNEPISPDILSSLATIVDTLGSRENEHNELNIKLDTILSELRHVKVTREVEDLNAKIKQLEAAIERDKRQLEQRIDERDNTLTGQASGVTYVRWGRMQCPGNGSRTLYEGYAAGGHFTHSGSSPSMLCLPRDPEWGKFDDKEDGIGSYMYGVEYEHNQPRANAIFGKSFSNFDVPCTVCESNRKSKIMIPGRVTCYGGWTREYWGYLMAGHYQHAAQGDYYCVDASPETLLGVATDHNGHLLYFVEVRCDALRCPPYVKGRELPCVVCTK